MASFKKDSCFTGVSSYGGLDRFRLLAAFLVIAIHVSPLALISPFADFFLTRILARIAVPFFFMITGYFVLGGDQEPARIRRFLLRTCLLYLFAILLYLPFGIYAGHYKGITVGGFFRMLFFEGTFYHLWYFPACILGVLLVSLLKRCSSRMPRTVILVLLYLVGVLGDSYYGLSVQNPVLAGLYGGLFQIFDHTRNGLFFAPLFLALGAFLSTTAPSVPETAKKKIDLAGFLVSFLLMTLEAFALKRWKLPRHDSMYLFLAPTVYFLFRLLLSVRLPSSRFLRNMGTWIYLLHPALLIVLRMIAKPLHLTWLLVDNPLVQFLSVSTLSAAAGFGLAVLSKKAETPSRKPLVETVSHSKASASPVPGNQSPRPGKGRAWIELNRNALRHNVEYLSNLAPKGCRLMPAVKANAYGHGALLLSQELNHLGIDAFCVACVSEGVKLRRHGITGEILILGYTHPSRFPLLHRYGLAQTVVDVSYGKLLNSFGQKLHVHIGIDSGMHRLGERSENITRLQNIWKMENLIVDGVFTHLCTMDGETEKETAYVKRQAEAFYQTVETLKQQGFSCPRLHLSSSYGLLRYPEFSEDYVRAGIALYGVLSSRKDTKAWGASLQPVLSLKARIASVKKLYPGESAGYGIQYTAETERTLAVLAIGYADGLPRSLSCGNGSVLIDGRKAPIVGKICMDQTLVDVTDIPGAKAGDVATLIGSLGDCRITACDWAEAAGTITNEILSRLGARLPRMWEDQTE